MPKPIEKINIFKKLIYTLSLYILITLKTFSCQNPDSSGTIYEDINDRQQEVLKIDEKKLKTIQRKVTRFYLMVYIPNSEYLHKLAYYQEEALNARLNNKLIRFFKMNYLENRSFVRKLNLKNLPALILFDKNLKEKRIIIDERLEMKNLVRFSEKADGKFQPVMIRERYQVNDPLKKNKKMLILLHPKANELQEEEDFENLLGMFMRYSVIAGYDYFHLCNETYFFDELVTPKDKNAKFGEDTFHFLAGFIKNDTTKILFDEKQIDQKNEADEFIREFNYFNLNIEEFKDVEKKEQKFLDLILNKKSNVYSSLGESDFNTLITHGKPTVIIVCDKKTMNKDKEFHKKMYNFAQKYDNEIKFYFSTDENVSIINLLSNFNFNHPVPFMFLLEKSDSGFKYYNKYVKKDLKLEIEEIQKFVDDYKAKKLPLFFVSEDIPTKKTENLEIISQNVTEMKNLTKVQKLAEKMYHNLTITKTNMTDEKFEEHLKKVNLEENYRIGNLTEIEKKNEKIEAERKAAEIFANNFTDVELNKKYYNKGENIYKIVGKNFEEFLYDTRDKIVAVFGCSSPMYFCDLVHVRIKLISRIFSKYLNKIVFVITDPNKNEFIVKKPNTDKNLDRPQDYNHYIADIVYPVFVTLDAVASKDGDRNELLNKKLDSVNNFEQEFTSENIIEYLLQRLNLTKEEADLEMDYLEQKDFSRKTGYTDEYDFDDERIEKVKKARQIDVLIEQVRYLVDFGEDQLKSMFETDPTMIKQFQDMVDGNFDPKKMDVENPEKMEEEILAQKGSEEL